MPTSRLVLRLLLATSLVLGGCPGTTEVPDAPSRDTAPGADAPLPGLDAAGLDAPALDAPELDAPGLDGGTDAPARTDASMPCDGLAAAACLGASCVPRFDDSCCPLCSEGPCGDCTDPDFMDCVDRTASPCDGPNCGTAPSWACDTTVTPDCEDAFVIDVDSCSVIGCVPNYPSGEGAPDTKGATCTPIVASSCTVACRRVAPPCPTGTFPEGDGACYTDRCIPNFVCVPPGA